MDSQSLSQLEHLCHLLYNATNEADRRHAHQQLLPLVTGGNPHQSIPQLQHVLANSKSPHALIFATTGLLKLLTSNWASVSEAQKEGLRNFLFEFLSSNGPDLYRNAAMVVSPFVRLLCRVIKLAWLEGPQHQNVTERVQAHFLSRAVNNSPLHGVLGLEIYTELTTDMQPAIGPAMSRYRRAALSFRDTALPGIFE